MSQMRVDRELSFLPEFILEHLLATQYIVKRDMLVFVSDRISKPFNPANLWVVRWKNYNT